MITSVKNESVKALKALLSRKGRREAGLHLIEGERLVFDALASGVAPASIFVSEKRPDIAARLAEAGAAFETVSEGVMASVSDTDTPQGLIASVRTPDTTPPEEYPAGLVVALDRVQDPGNLGTILRTADAFDAAGLLLSEGCADPWSPKAARSAMGSAYHIPVWQGELTDELKKLKAQGFFAVCGHLKGREALPELPEKRVLIIGNEANGVSDEASEGAYLYRLPMKGRAESLNAAAAAAVLIYLMS
ncbi:MAG: RNA methyltransferase [Clostridia bacterium]|nr:RNA methyltransferase [Clostridia bacterium]